MTNPSSWGQGCPIPVTTDMRRVSLAHGEGARASRRFITEYILPRFPGTLRGFADAAVVTLDNSRIAICTDSHTVSPMFFPGGDLGSLSVFGTVNDLAVAGARPRWLTLSLILEDGLPFVVLERILDSVASAASQCGVAVITGDTKVVPRGAADGIFINTTGVGELVDPVPPGPGSVRIGDKVLVSGPVGQHGIAVMSARDRLVFESTLHSDSASVIPQVTALRNSVGEHVRAIRDATRGGVSAVLHEWALECRHTFALTESCVPLTDDVRGACELLGLDPLYVANEGRIVVAINPRFADSAVNALRQVPGCEQAAIIGEVQPPGISPVTIRRTFAAPQPLDEPSGAPLPRIC